MKTLKVVNLREAFAVSNAINEHQGFIKKADAGGYSGKMSNGALLYRHFSDSHTGDNEYSDPSEKDFEMADEMIFYFKGLGFKVFERPLSDFETNILKFINDEEISHSAIGIIGALPSIYHKNCTQDEWGVREADLARTSDFVGVLRTRGAFNLTVEMVRPCRDESHFVCCSEDGKNIVKFFLSNQTPPKVGDVISIAAFVKSHEVSNYHNGKETMINRVSMR